MSSGTTSPLDQELQILFGALCDGLRQEVRTRQLALLASGENVSIIGEREAGIASAIAFHLRSVGFLVQVEAYILGDLRRRPDFRIWLPKSGKYLYLELKTYGWGDSERHSYFYTTITKAIEKDMDKLAALPPNALPNGMFVVGFSQPDEHNLRIRMPLSKAYEELSAKITKYHRAYQQVGVLPVDLHGLDDRTDYAMVGLWVRKPPANPGEADQPAHPELVEGHERV